MEFLGCYSINDKFFNFNQGFLFSLEMTVDISSFFYCTRTDCTCNDRLNNLFKEDQKRCNRKCNGNIEQSCGGRKSGTFSVYSKRFVEAQKHAIRSDHEMIREFSSTSLPNTTRPYHIEIYKNESSIYESYTICEDRNLKTNCYMIPVYIIREIFYNTFTKYNQILWTIFILILLILLLMLIINFRSKFYACWRNLLSVGHFNEKNLQMAPNSVEYPSPNEFNKTIVNKNPIKQESTSIISEIRKIDQVKGSQKKMTNERDQVLSPEKNDESIKLYYSSVKDRINRFQTLNSLNQSITNKLYDNNKQLKELKPIPTNKSEFNENVFYVKN